MANKSLRVYPKPKKSSRIVIPARKTDSALIANNRPDFLAKSWGAKYGR